ncbi:hypothetical protein [Methyloversatilis discipulorum]|uniref:hypothetical protein n=1 Tax=Methyloversatilis discipulorum TaxID=1119528 RepID=UPI001A61B94A|nr:hypothetical protein [Methyloversatilis discipulorum]MBL8468000.1 hypothetical protein [Methyloversatilis discipulorum]
MVFISRKMGCGLRPVLCSNRSLDEHSIAATVPRKKLFTFPFEINSLLKNSPLDREISRHDGPRDSATSRHIAAHAQRIAHA